MKGIIVSGVDQGRIQRRLEKGHQPSLQFVLPGTDKQYI